MEDIVFVHGMFQNPKSWEKWIEVFTAKGYNCHAPAWPLHDGEPRDLRAHPPIGLGHLHLRDVIDHLETIIADLDSKPIMIGHSVGGLVTQILLDKGVIARGVAISSIAPNAMVDLDWGFLNNSATIANPLKGDEPIYMDANTFHEAFANTLTVTAATAAFEEFATHDSRNVLRDCMGKDGRIDLDSPHGPLLLIAASNDQIVPAHLVEKNFKAYSDSQGISAFKAFPNRSHYIRGEPGWEDVAQYAAIWLEQTQSGWVPVEDIFGERPPVM